MQKKLENFVLKQQKQVEKSIETNDEEVTKQTKRQDRLKVRQQTTYMTKLEKFRNKKGRK